MRHYKVYTNFTNYIPIDETELEKAMRAFQKGIGVIFNNGATQRVESVVPDDLKNMGWNEGYKPTPEEMGEISRDRNCLSARSLIGQVKNHLALSPNEPFKELQAPTKHTKGLTSLEDILKLDEKKDDEDTLGEITKK